MSSAHRYSPHYTVDDYRQWQGDWELWGGTAIAMTPSPFAPHERLVVRFVTQLATAMEIGQCDCQVYAGLDWVVSDDTVVRPDVMVVCGQQPQEHLRRPPELVVEVLSPATAAKDLGPKRLLYESQGVGYYLLADPRDGTLRGYALASGGDGLRQYRPLEAGEHQVLRLPCGCRLRLDRDRLFR